MQRVLALAKTKGPKEREKKRLFELSEQLAKSTGRSEQRRLKAELARLTFGS
jgi:hypothetical protein